MDRRERLAPPLRRGSAGGQARPARRFSRWAAIILAVAALVTRTAQPAAAHANLVRSEPAAGSVLEQAPSQVQLWFSEPPELTLSDVRLLDGSGKVVSREPVRPAPSDPLSLVLPLPELSPGVYTIVWRVTSAVDGHTTTGTVPFSVGAPGAAGVAPPLQATQQAPPVQALPVAIRWLELLGGMVVAGGLVFVPLVWQPALVRTAAQAGSAGRTGSRGRRRRRSEGRAPEPASFDLPGVLAAACQAALQPVRAAWAVWLIASLLAYLDYAAKTGGTTLVGALSGPVLTVLGTRYGTLLLTRVVLLATLGAILWAPAAGTWRWWAGAALAAAALLTRSLTAHAAALPQATAGLLLDWVHLVAAAVWVGGLVQLALAVPGAQRRLDERRRAQTLAQIIPRFSLAAGLAVLVLTLTGLVQAAWLAGAIEALWSTTYGLALALKLALLLPTLALAAFHLLHVSPQLRTLVRQRSAKALESAAALAERFRFTVTLEAAAGVALVLAVAFLTLLPPAREALAARKAREEGLSQTVTADDLRVRLQVRPGAVGFNRFTVELAGARGQSVLDVERVALRFRMLAHDMGESELILRRTGTTRYEGEGQFFSMAGPWQVTALVRRPGRDDARAQFSLNVPAVADLPPVPAGGERVAPNWLLLGGGVALLSGLGALAVAWLLRERPRISAVMQGGVAGVGIALATAGFALLLFGFGPEGKAFALALPGASAQAAIPAQNPYPPTPDSLAIGQRVYEQYCSTCHGIAGRGDGPLAASLPIPPADLRVHVPQHSDGFLFQVVSDGIPGTPMPGFAGSLSEEERWHVLNYMRALAAGG
jgi:copper transport protein